MELLQQRRLVRPKMRVIVRRLFSSYEVAAVLVIFMHCLSKWALFLPHSFTPGLKHTWRYANCYRVSVHLFVWLFVCVFVCLSQVGSSTKMAIPRITQTTPCNSTGTLHHLQKKVATLFLPLILPNADSDRFSFTDRVSSKCLLFSKAIIKYPTTLWMRLYTTLWNINVRKTATTWNMCGVERDLGLVGSFTNTLLQIYC